MGTIKDKKSFAIKENVDVFVDDLRSPLDGWKLARNFSEAIGYLKTGKVENLSLDYDLGEVGGATGEDILYWIIGRMIMGVFYPPIIFVHSDNPFGIQRLIALKNDIEMLESTLNDGTLLLDTISRRRRKVK